jgi:hypothetical protein
MLNSSKQRGNGLFLVECYPSNGAIKRERRLPKWMIRRK